MGGGPGGLKGEIEVQLSGRNIGNVLQPNGKKPEVENPRWWPLNLKYEYLSLYTREQRNSKGHTNVFGVQLSNGTISQCCAIKPEVENPRWRSLTLKYLYISMYTRKRRNPTAVPMFSGYSKNETVRNTAQSNQKKPEVDNPRWRHLNLKYYISAWIQLRDSNKIPMAISICFRDQATRLD